MTSLKPEYIQHLFGNGYCGYFDTIHTEHHGHVGGCAAPVAFYCNTTMNVRGGRGVPPRADHLVSSRYVPDVD